MAKVTQNQRIKIIKEISEVVEKELNEDFKLSPFIRMQKGTLKELVKQINKLQVEEE